LRLFLLPSVQQQLPAMSDSRTVCVISLGCPKNLVDSEHILGVLARAGWRIAAAPELADVIIVNTCGFLQSARDEAFSVVAETLGRLRPEQQVAVAGCLVQRELPELRRRFPRVGRFVGIDGIPDLPRILARADLQEPGQSAVGSLQSAICDPLPLPSRVCGATLPRLVSTPRHYAYLRIADGCDNCCAYCLIPGIRGRLRSRSIADIVREAAMLARNGARELILIAQDTTIYGKDIDGRQLLAPLLRRLAGVAGIEWLRVLYTHPAHFTPDILDELATNDRVVKYVDLPLQHVSDRLLRRMNRGYQRAEAEALLECLHRIPGMAVRTTFITGLPGETESEFTELLAFVRAGHFAHVGCFAYSPEPGTPAARMKTQVPARIREERAREIVAAQRRVSLARNRALVGRTVEVRIDSHNPNRGEYLGRTCADAPEIDNAVHISGRGLKTGDLVATEVIRAGAYDLWTTIQCGMRNVECGMPDSTFRTPH
jgi:ribosomal protein S12 methylthiotransferase